MILDYAFNKSKRVLSLSYVTDCGGKRILNFNVDKFKSYYKTITGAYENWDGTRCDVKWVDNPSTFEMKTYFDEMPNGYKVLLQGKTNPKLYTFDIEVEISDEFPEPSEARFPITTISVASPDCNVIVMGTKELEKDGEKNLQNRFNEYLGGSKFFKDLNLPQPYIKYVKFNDERSMLEYFLKNVVAKVPVLGGWNSIMFDWQYIQNRLRGYYPDLSINASSINWMTTAKNYTDMKGNKVRLVMPNHTLILDMMDVIGNFDMVVMPIKESLSLDYIASESIGMNKIKYDGDLQKLYETDYSTYVFYNAIDSILVQLIDKKFKTLQNIYTQSLICKERIGSCFSKIALSEALFFNYFSEKGIKIVPPNIHDRDRGTLVGAYVAKPVPGKHKWVTCNDFASLYPNIIRTTNISIENYVGSFYDEERLKKYRNNDYVVVGGTVFKNAGTKSEARLGEWVGTFLLDDELEKYRKDKNYFVSVNGHVYKNDKDYSFRCIQTSLYENRNASKYLAKQLDATIISDVDHILSKGSCEDREYGDNIVKYLKDVGYKVNNSNDLLKIQDLKEFKDKVKKEIVHLTSFEQACKLLMNSMYGGCSHVAFAFFSLELANDITGEARNIIKIMEKHIPEWFDKNWKDAKDLHEMLGIKLKKNCQCSNLAKVVAGDTDSIYLSFNELQNTIENNTLMSTEQLRDVLVNLNVKFLDGHNREFMREYYETRHAKSTQNFELETIALSECRLDVKKRYAQLLAWKDGKCYDLDNLPLKTKGLEMIKSSYPKQARESLKSLVRYLLEDEDEKYITQRLNIKMQEEKKKFYDADLEDICGNVGVQNYTKYIIDDTDPQGLTIAPKCPYNVRALGNYNWLRNVHKLPGDPLYGGKMKYYVYWPNGIKNKKGEPQYFAFQSRNYPKWADKYAPVARDEMFQRMVIDPFNRIMSSIGLRELNNDGSIQCNLFDLF